jgi:hypothetical protein
MSAQKGRGWRWRFTSCLGPVIVAAALVLPSCAGDGHFTILGYSTRPNYDTSIRTVRVPIFKSRTLFSVAPTPGLEMDLTRAVVREIEAKTPYKVVTCDADTELTGTIVAFNKSLLNYTQQNEIREAETTMTVEVVWRDLRTGEPLTRRARRRGEGRAPRPFAPLDPLLQAQQARPPLLDTPAAPFEESGPGRPLTPEEFEPLPGEAPPPEAEPLLIRSFAHFRPELGESMTTAMQKNVNRMATQIVSMMEQPW